MSGFQADSFPKTDFIPVEYSEVKQVKFAFKKLMRACVPSTVAADRDQTFLRYGPHSGRRDGLSGRVTE